MTAMDVALMACAAGPALVVAWYCFCSIVEMTPETPHGFRLALILLTVGAFAELIALCDLRVPDHSEILLLTGLAVMVRSNCKRGTCPCVVLPSPVTLRGSHHDHA